jgi:hypothetical protein
MSQLIDLIEELELKENDLIQVKYNVGGGNCGEWVNAIIHKLNTNRYLDTNLFKLPIVELFLLGEENNEFHDVCFFTENVLLFANDNVNFRWRLCDDEEDELESGSRTIFYYDNIDYLKNVLRLYIENFIDEELDIIILEHKGIFINKLANNVISKILEVRDNTIYYTVNHDFVCNCIDEDVCSMENFLDSEDEGVDVEEKTEE